MPVWTTWPLIGGLSVLATATGVTLGRAAIEDINPIYFQPPPSHFYADGVPNRPSGNAQPDLGGTDYLQAEYAYSAAPGCANCDAYPTEYKPRHDKAVDGAEDGRAASVRMIRETVVTIEESVPPPPPPNRQWVERYTDYPVAAEPVQEVTEEAPAVQES